MPLEKQKQKEGVSQTLGSSMQVTEESTRWPTGVSTPKIIITSDPSYRYEIVTQTHTVKRNRIRKAGDTNTPVK